MPEYSFKAPDGEARPLELESQMKDYLTRFRSDAKKVFWAYQFEYQRSLDRHGSSLIRAANQFDGQTLYGIGRKQLMVNGKASQVLDHINMLTLENPLVWNFSQVILKYYADIEKDLKQMVDGVKQEGVSYFLDDFNLFNEEAATNLGGVAEKFVWAGDEGQSQLCLLSPDYAEVEEGRNERVRRMKESSGYADEQITFEQKRLIIQRLHHIEYLMKRGGLIQDASHEMLLATSEIMHHLAESLGAKSLQKLNVAKERASQASSGGPLERLDVSLTLLNNMIREYEDCIVLHRDLLLGSK